MTRTLALVLLAAAGPPALAADPATIPASLVSIEKATTAAVVLAAVERQSGIKVSAGAVDGAATVGPFAKKPLWEVLEAVAAKTNTRLAVSGGKPITFDAGRATTAASLDGPFRVAEKGVTAKIDAATGRTSYVLELDVHWEPRFPVFRIDAQPRVTGAADDLGNRLTVRETSVKSAVAGFSHVAEVRVEGLTRKATAIAQITGEFSVTASPAMLAFEFDDLTALPATKEKDGVKATLTKVVKREDVWELQVAYEYRTPPPHFESFESWTNRNTFQLVTPKKTAAAEVANYDIVTNDRHVAAAYRFNARAVDLTNRAGWAVRCETPAPLIEFPVKFTLRNVKLP